jgi:regulator of sigma E protease
MALFIFILVLILLILVHEFGHFIVAKLFGIKVEEFGIFFPPRLFSKKFGETIYSFNLLPVGGFVRIFGENIDESDPSIGADPRSFVHKPRYIQAAVIVAGIIFNLLFAWLILSVGYMVGMQTSKDHVGFGQVANAQTTILDVVAGSPADKAGIKANDVIEKIQTGTAMLVVNPNDAKDADSNGVQAFIVAHQDESMVFSVLRNKTDQTFLAKPVAGLTPGHKAVGIELDDVGILKLSAPLALAQGALLAKDMTVETAEGLGGFLYSLVTGTAQWGSVSGPIGIASIGSSAVQQGFVATIVLAALISINLAIINLIPIPGLDGGRFLFIVIEAIRRKPISEKTSTRFTIAGFALLVILMLVVSFHDVLKLVHPV